MINMKDDMKSQVGKNAAACLYCLLLPDDQCDVHDEEMERVAFYKNILPPTPLLQRGGGYATTCIDKNRQ